MAHREAAAKRILPKTGVDAIDSEAVVVQACLGRIEDNLAADARSRAAKRAVTRVVPGPASRMAVHTSTKSELPGNADAVDVSHRTDMGTSRDIATADKDDHETLPERTDAIVAQSALLRLMRLASSIGSRVDHAEAAAADATARANGLQKRVDELEAIVALQASRLASKDDPDEAFRRYRELWAEKQAAAQQMLAADMDVRKNAIEALLNKRKGNSAARKLVRERRKMFRSRLEAFAETADEDAEIEAMMKGFAPLPAVVAEADGSHEAPQFALRSLGTMRGSMAMSASLAMTPTPHAGDKRKAALAADHTFGSMVASPTSATHHAAGSSITRPPRGPAGRGVSLPSHSMPDAAGSDDESMGTTPQPGKLTPPPPPGRGVPGEELVLDNMDRLLDAEAGDALNVFDRSGSGSDDDDDESVAGGDSATEAGSPTLPVMDGAAGGKKPKRAAVRADELVITRFLGSADRSVARMDPTATYIGVLLGALRFAPSEYTVLELDTDAMAGRRAALARQAAVAGITSFWDEVANCAAPVVTIAQCDPPAFAFAKNDGSVMVVHHTSANDTATSLNPVVRPDAHVTVLTERYAGSHFESKTVTESIDPASRAVLSQYRGAVPVRRQVRLPEQQERAEVREQHPGILAVLSRGSVAGERLDVISTGAVRCYASSMMTSCKVDSLVAPFFDLHSPYFSTKDAPGQFVVVAFENIAITPMAYSFACTHPTSGGFFPRSWVLEGSLDGNAWTTLRTHTEDDTLNRYCPVGTWALAPKAGTYFCQFRVRQCGPNAAGTRHLNVCSFEVYGRAMFVREKQPIAASRLPIVPRSFQNDTSATHPAERPANVLMKLPARATIRFPRFDELPPEPVPVKGKKGKKGGKK